MKNPHILSDPYPKILRRPSIFFYKYLLICILDPDASDKRHKHHKKHKHKKHKKHKSSKSSGSIKHTTTNEGDDGSTEQEVELDRIEYNMNVIEDGVTLPLDEHHFLMDAEHCEVK